MLNILEFIISTHRTLHLQSEDSSRGYIDLFDVLNPMVISISTYVLCLPSYGQKRVHFTILNIHPQSASSTVRTSLEMVDTPIRCAESDGSVRWDVQSLCEQRWRKTFLILGLLTSIHRVLHLRSERL